MMVVAIIGIFYGDFIHFKIHIWAFCDYVILVQ